MKLFPSKTPFKICQHELKNFGPLFITVKLGFDRTGATPLPGSSILPSCEEDKNVSHPFSTSPSNCCTQPQKATITWSNLSQDSTMATAQIRLSEAQDRNGFHREQVDTSETSDPSYWPGCTGQYLPVPSSINLIPRHRNTGQVTQFEGSDCAKHPLCQM